METGLGLYSSAKALYRVVRRLPYLGLLDLPLARARHRRVLRGVRRSDHHTYTCFYRSRRQLDAIVGPVCDALWAQGVRHAIINVFAASNGAEAYSVAAELLHRRPALDFTIRGSDLHPETVAQGRAATYASEEAGQGGRVPAELLERTFDRQGEAWVVKRHIRDKVGFEQADLLDPAVVPRYPGADLVLAQNVLFHLPPERSERAFHHALATVKRGGFLLVEGMDLDQRVALTTEAGLEPLDFAVREIYAAARQHVPENWWDYYYGSEPYSPFAAERLRRYCSIFRVP
ncbi:MAG: hypothetical protein IPJ65_29000 [Archangiaceae bacterium]|nr:hypothetical protein [Archangiaceae bacterium]